MKPADVEAALVGYLEPILGVRVATRVPNPRPASHVRVGRAGGSRRNLAQENPLILIECWAPTSTAASDLASKAWGALDATCFEIDLAGAVWVSEASLGSPVNYPDPDAPGSSRYQFTASLVVNLKESA